MQTAVSGDHPVYKRRGKTKVDSFPVVNDGCPERDPVLPVTPARPKPVQVYARRQQRARNRLEADLADSAAMNVVGESGERKQSSLAGGLLNFALVSDGSLHETEIAGREEVGVGAEVASLLDAFSAEDDAWAEISFTELLSSSIVANLKSFSVERASAANDGDRGNVEGWVDKEDAHCTTGFGPDQPFYDQTTESTSRADVGPFSAERASTADDGDRDNEEGRVLIEDATCFTGVCPDQAHRDQTTGSTLRANIEAHGGKEGSADRDNDKEDATCTTRADAFAPLTPLHSRNVHKIRRIIGIDLNKMPRQKPRKKKHATPKIAIEGNFVKTPKPKSRANGSSTGMRKRKYMQKSFVESSSTPYVEERPRKYVRRKGLVDSPITPAEDVVKGYAYLKSDYSPEDIGKVSDSTFALKEKSCKRCLNFEEESKKNVAALQELPEVEMNKPGHTESFEIAQSHVQRRAIKRSKCLIRSRKAGPNVPEKCKRKRTERQRKVILGSLPCFSRSFKKKRSIRRRRVSILGLWSLILKAVHEKQRTMLQKAPRRRPKTKVVKVKNMKEKFQAVEQGQKSPNDARVLKAPPIQSPKNMVGATECQMEGLLEHTIQKLMHLNIKDVGSSLTLVPYKPKQKTAKVHLDAETMRVWNQLMMLEGADRDNSGEAEKGETWERERNKFRKWVDNFTSFMHMILGDRRFTPWKGSVVDSVVGVFLTQNVADYLSSSAFMSLCAKFPPKSSNEEKEDAENAECAEQIVGNAGFIVTDAESDDETRIWPSTAEDEYSSLTEGSKLVQDVPPISTESTHLSNASPFSANGKQLEGKESRHIWRDPMFEEAGVDNHVQVKKETTTPNRKKKNVPPKEKKTMEPAEWERLRKMYSNNGPRHKDRMDSVDWEAVRCAKLEEVAETIRERGQHYVIAYRIQEFLTRLVTMHGSIDLEWLRNCPPGKVKDYLLEVNGLGLKSVECVRLLCLQNMAFPVDTNVGRIAVRLGWVPLQPLPDHLRLHLLEKYPIMDEIQKYLWPRLCTLDQRTLYELHYHLITFGKVFCTKRSPNCNACPLRADCKHFGSAFASAYSLPAPQGESIVTSVVPVSANETNCKPSSSIVNDSITLLEANCRASTCEPIIEEPTTPEPEPCTSPLRDIEDFWLDNDSDDNIPPIKLDSSAFVANVCSIMNEINMPIQDHSLALVALTPEAASIPLPKLKYVSRLRTEHQVYELPDAHPILRSLERREPDDPCPYLLAIWPGKDTTEMAEPICKSQNSGGSCSDERCPNCYACPDDNPSIVKGTILIPCRTAMRGSFPLNGTYFQVNEVFADDESSRQPIDVPRNWIWNLRRRTSYFGTSTTTIMRGLSMDEIQKCFWRGFVCVRGFDRKKRAPRPLLIRFHRPTGEAGKGAAAADDE